VGIADVSGWVLAVSSGEGIALAIASVAAVAAALSTGIGAWQGVLMKRSERNRTQPIVVVYERGDPEEHDGKLHFSVSLANEGAGPAFNVRFGIAVEDVELAYEPRPAGAEGAGDVPRALGPGRTLPEGGRSYSLAFSESAVDKREDALARRVFWCRYANAFGDTWETRNAWRAGEELEIRAIPRARAVP
jgi:hypothetical protein